MQSNLNQFPIIPRMRCATHDTNLGRGLGVPDRPDPNIDIGQAEQTQASLGKPKRFWWTWARLNRLLPKSLADQTDPKPDHSPDESDQNVVIG